MRLAILKLRNAVRGSAARSVGAGAAWTGLGAVFSRGAPLLYSIIVARALGGEGAGQFAMVQSTAATVLTLAGTGVHIEAARSVAQRRAEQPQRLVGTIVRLSVILALLAGTALVLAGEWVAVHVLSARELAPAVRTAGALIAVFGTVSTACAGALMGLNGYRSIAMANVATGVVGVIGVTIGAYLAGLTGALGGVALAYLVNYVVLQRALMTRTGDPAASSWKSEPAPPIGTVFKRSIPLGMSYGLYALGGWLALAILARDDGGYGEVGVYAIANQWQSAILFVPSALTIALLPHWSRLTGTGVSARGSFATGAIVSGGIAVAGAIVVAVLAQPLLGLYGSAFEGREAVLRAMAAVAVAVAIANLGTQMLYARGLWRSSLVGQGLYCASLVWLAHALVPGYGAMGLVLASGFAHGVLAVSNTWAIARSSPSPG